MTIHMAGDKAREESGVSGVALPTDKALELALTEDLGRFVLGFWDGVRPG